MFTAFQSDAFQNDAFQIATDCDPAFTASGFQNDAFQICGATTPPAETAVGFPGRRHHPRELERRLKKQRDETFNRRWYNEFLDAKEEAERRALALESEERAALEEAARLAEEVSEAAEAANLADQPRFDELTAALESATAAKRSATIIEQARHAAAIAMAFKAYIEEVEDEEETIMLLLS